MGDERERECVCVERETERAKQNEEEDGGVRILTFCFIFTNRFSIGNNLMK